MGWLWGREDMRDRRRDDVSTPELARRFNEHMEECREDKAQLHKKLDAHSEDSDKKHADNLVRFGKIERAIYIAMGMGIAVGWIVTHGSDVLAKLAK